MKQFFVFFLCFAVQFNCGRAFVANQTDMLASVREFPSLLHRCTATFIKPDILLTTARCLYCTGHCKLFVQVFSDHLTGGNNFIPQAFPVEDVVIHPDYERYPQRNDVGLIKLKTLVSEAILFELPSPRMKFRNVLTNTYAWKFSPDLQDYFLHLNPARTISNAICSLALNQYVDDTNVCVRGQESFSFGAFDQGSPLLANITGQWYILGIYAREGITRFSKSEMFESVSPFTDWIKAEIGRKYEITNLFTNAISLSPANNVPQGSASTPALPAPNPQPSPNVPSTGVAQQPSPLAPAPAPQTPPAPPIPIVNPAVPAQPIPIVNPAVPAPAPVPQTPSAPPTPTPNKPEANVQASQTADKKYPQSFRLSEEDNIDGKPVMLSDNFDV